MRCPDCMKFVPYDEPQVEVTDIEVDVDSRDGGTVSATVRGSVRVVLPCQECGDELKDTEMEFEASFTHKCQSPEGTEDGFEVEAEGEGNSRMDPSEKEVILKNRGRKIVSVPSRYRRTYYGADITVTATCAVCAETEVINISVDVSASSFNELV